MQRLQSDVGAALAHEPKPVVGGQGGEFASARVVEFEPRPAEEGSVIAHVVGTPGGSTIITTNFQIVTNHIDFKIPVQTSVDAPRFHHQHLPDYIRYENGGLPAEVVEKLRARGHEVRERSGVSGNVESIYIAPDGTRIGGADPRRDSQALGH